MPASISTALAAALTVAAVLYGALHVLLNATHDAREPPPISSSIPFIGSMIGLARKKSKYYTELRYVQLVCILLVAPVINGMIVQS
jgi:phosphate/sulfate permease